MKQTIPRAKVAPNSHACNAPPTPPPMPAFLKKSLQQKESDCKGRLRVKLILPHEPPGETSTDDQIVEIKNEEPKQNQKSRVLISHANPHDSRPHQILVKTPPPPPSRRSRSKIERLVFSGQVFNIMSGIISLLTLFVFLAVFFINKSDSLSCDVAKCDGDDVLEGVVTDTLIKELNPYTSEDDEVIRRFSLKNTRGLELIVMSYGATITNLILPDKDDIVLGFDSLSGYQGDNNPYFGSTVGRVANRIAGGRFSVAGQQYNLTVNNGPNTLHGGVQGWDKKNWRSSVEDDRVVFSLLSEDGDQGFPGNVLATTTYRLSEDNQIRISMTAVTDEATPVNMVNHAYYNLAGHDTGSRGLYDHVVRIRAPWYTPVTLPELIPTGDIEPVINTLFDLTEGVRLGNMLSSVPGPTKENNGFDHNFVVSKQFEDKMRLVSVVEYPKKMRSMKIFSNQPGVQFYTGNFLPKTGFIGKSSANYSLHGGFCLETQNFPDFVNNPQFPDGILHPGQTYHHKTAVQLSF